MPRPGRWYYWLLVLSSRMRVTFTVSESGSYTPSITSALIDVARFTSLRRIFHRGSVIERLVRPGHSTSLGLMPSCTT